ncbi:7-cyano-7-deazaguanine synthase QueC [Marinicella sp. W31]|uniref:7-cyano-7-deazaguanine synthase QueC n=1 Tax=Marinicella sp. W31 TaxID=3023713 RepID=UPI0037577C53
MTEKLSKRCVVLLSGGLDSTTVLAYAKDQGFECYTIAVDYGQRHRAELQAAARISTALGAVEHRVVNIDLTAIGGSALTDDIAVPETRENGVPITYVPARNTIFLSTALGYAEVIGAQHIFIGVTAVDYSGYPDCRSEYIAAFEAMANLATKAATEDGHKLRLETPLIDLSKSEIIRLGTDLEVDYALTVSCYQADDRGRACGRCDSCYYRREGFQQAGLSDPTHYQESV